MSREKVLQDLAIKLTIVADGTDESLQKLLRDLRKSLKSASNEDQLKEFSRNLASHALVKNSEPAKTRTAWASLDPDLNKLISSLKPDETLKRSLATTTENLLNETDPTAQLQNLTTIFSLIRQGIEKLKKQHGSPGGVLGWFSAKGAKEQSQNWLDAFLQSTVDLLGKILELLSNYHDKPHQISLLKVQLNDAESIESIEQVLSSVLDILTKFAESIKKERIATQNYLGILQEKLNLVEENIFSVIGDGDASLERAQTLNLTVKENIETIDQDVKSSQNLESLQNTMENRLFKLSERVANYLEEEKLHHEKSKHKITSMAEKVHNLEREAEELKLQLKVSGELALKDTLTGAYNRAGYEALIQREFSRKARKNSPLSIIFIDCNNFKTINDTYGHNAGDLVLQKVAEILSKRARQTDIIARYGGDEFIAVLPDTPIDGALIFAQTVSKTIRSAGFNDNGHPIDFSISCGLTEVRPEDDPLSAQIRADEAMYIAKKQTETKIHTV